MEGVEVEVNMIKTSSTKCQRSIKNSIRLIFAKIKDC